jgi:DNA-binding NarL/FixJ family response regulator
MRPIRVLLADDHELVRKGIRSLLEATGRVEVIAEAHDGREALRLIRAQDPEVVLMDIAMPGLNGLDATARAVRDMPSLPVIILSMHATKEYVIEALRAGASGYVLKNAPVEELEQAIHAVHRGEKYLTPAISGQLMESFIEQSRRPARDGAEGGEGTLTSRQREVLQLIAEGRSTREIAEALHLSVKTVETHRMQIMARLDIHDVAGLVRYAIRAGLVSTDD